MTNGCVNRRLWSRTQNPLELIGCEKKNSHRLQPSKCGTVFRVLTDRHPWKPVISLAPERIYQGSRNSSRDFYIKMYVITYFTAEILEIT